MPGKVPGEVYSGHVRSVGYGISVGQAAPPGIESSTMDTGVSGLT